MNSLRYIFPLFTSVAQDQPALRKDFTHCRFIILGIGLLGAASTSAAASRPMQPDTTSVFYPLTIGNYWEYYEYASFGGGIVDTVTRTVTGYTTIGSRAYAVIEFHSPRYDQVSNSFERVDSLGDVYSYSSGGDLLEYRVSDTSVTPWAYGSVSRRWNENVVDTAYGRLRQILVALTYQPLDTLGVFGFGTGLMEGIGMTWSLSAEGGGEVFKGAKIDGVVYGTVTSVDEQPAGIPDEYELLQNYPNPFNPTTSIRFDLAHAGQTTVIIYDIIGRTVTVLIDEWKPAGRYTQVWNAENVSGGVYFCRLRSGDNIQTIKMLHLE